MKAQIDYWRDSLIVAAEGCGLTLSKEQANYLAEAMAGSHENYGLAFHRPSADDRLRTMRREQDDAYKRLTEEAQRQHGIAIKRLEDKLDSALAEIRVLKGGKP